MREETRGWLQEFLSEGAVRADIIDRSRKLRRLKWDMVRRCKNDIRAVNFFYDGRWYWCLISDIRMRDAVDTPAALTQEPEGPVITDPAALTGMMVNAVT
jgi:hypothetical protein